jgi:hypothetical protein
VHRFAPIDNQANASHRAAIADLALHMTTLDPGPGCAERPDLLIRAGIRGPHAPSG